MDLANPTISICTKSYCQVPKHTTHEHFLAAAFLVSLARVVHLARFLLQAKDNKNFDRFCIMSNI